MSLVDEANQHRRKKSTVCKICQIEDQHPDLRSELVEAFAAFPSVPLSAIHRAIVERYGTDPVGSYSTLTRHRDVCMT